MTRVTDTWKACERCVLWCCIALGQLQLIALKFPEQIWASFTRFLRSRSRALPSERTVKAVLAQELVEDFHRFRPSAMMQEMHRLGQRPHEADEQEVSPSMRAPCAVSA